MNFSSKKLQDILKIVEVIARERSDRSNLNNLIIKTRLTQRDPFGTCQTTARKDIDLGWLLVKCIFLLGLLSIFSTDVFAQVTPQVQMFRNEPKGNINYRKKGILDGNLVRTVYQNSAEVSDWFNGAVSAPHGEWPKGTGHRSLDGLGILLGAKVTIVNPLNPATTKDITPIESSYREEMDTNPVTGDIWGLEPVPGYVNPASTRPGINIDKSTFPSVWPRSIFYDLYGTQEDSIKKWDGFWYGYFGRGVSNAQLETYFVIDDSPDQEFTGPVNRFFPISTDSARGGLGLRVEVRGFQWTHVLAEDIIFWHYDIVNMSDYNYDSTVFGFYTDPSVGSVNNDARFDKLLDMAYAWAPSGKGLPNNYKTGYYGQSFLESPGNGTNGLDDDGDAIKTDGTFWKSGGAFNPAMIDERRNDGIDNDEDWVGYTDANKNGKWDGEEPLNDDLGKDGVGVFDIQYKGPDEGEGDGLPTLGEPSFDRTDKDESDQIGLQSAYINILGDKSETGVWPKNDGVMWNKMTGGFVDTAITSANISVVFSSGIFPLKQSQRERFSIAILFGDDLADLIFNKLTVQAIYNANYNFAQPPLTPTLTAIPGNKKVYLYWDAVAEKSYDRFLKKFDFEGYLLYRSSEPEFQDLKIVTDSKGQGKYWKPLMQWDVVDTIRGQDPVGINGAHFWRGDETGLVNSFIDTTVVNGTKYYYALVSYDQGVVPKKLDPYIGTTDGLTPSECTKIISEDFSGTLKFVDQNCAVVVPNAQAAGYIPALLDGITTPQQNGGIGTGSMVTNIVNPNSVLEGYTYQIRFDSTGKFPKYVTTSFNILRKAPSAVTYDTLLKNIAINSNSAPINGLTIGIKNDVQIEMNDSATGLLPGFKTNATIEAHIDRSFSAINVAWPGDYEIRFYDINSKQDVGAFEDPSGPFITDSVNFIITNTTSGYRCKFLIQDMDANGKYTTGDSIRIMDGYVDDSNFKICYTFSYKFVQWWNPPIPPAEGDKFVIKTKKPFAGGDYFEFKTHASRMDNTAAKNQLNKISVVPNPYVVAAKWERRTLYQSGRGDRKIDFVNLPSACTIKIFTVAGALVKTIEKEMSATNGAVSWDLISDDGMEVAYGLYIYHVKAPNVGEHIGKFAVIK
ncbi:MAG: hypothetical protein Q8L88_07955 [Bacteroidota bacterium]|nr:hypothetical protein [Bacteroidota bacterium]